MSEITLPVLSAGMEEGTVTKWLVASGDQIEVGQALAEIETDKATVELTAEIAGQIAALLVAEGSYAKVGQPILRLAGGDAAPVEANAPPKPVEPVPAAAPQPESHQPKHRASPLARRLAAAAGIDIGTLTGSGPGGRIVRLDVENHRPPAPASAPTPTPSQPSTGGSLKPLTSMRRAIARRLTEAKTTVPHFYLTMDCALDRLLALRHEINAERAADQRISVNDFIIKAVAKAYDTLPEANVQWHPDGLFYPDRLDIAVAVATEGGLYTPLLRAPQQTPLATLSAQMRDLAARAREGSLRPEDYQGGSASISNLGMYGVSQFAAILNPPQSAIFAIGAASERAVGRNGQLVLAQMLTITLSADHRCVDGALAAELLAEVRKGLEHPLTLLI